MADENENKGLKPGDEGYVAPENEGKKDGEGDELTPEDIKKLQADNAALKSSNSRLEGESKENKKKYQDKVNAEEKAKRDKLEADGKDKELLEAEREDKKRIANELLETKARSVRTKLENEILILAPNCHDVKDIVANLDKTMYSIDTTNETVSGVKDALADVLKRKPYLFSKKKMPESFNGGTTDGEGDDDKNKNKNKKMLTIEEYGNLPTKKAMQDALSEGRVEGLEAS